MDKPFLQTARARMEKSLETLRHELATLRTGRASLTMLDEIRVEYYGTAVPLNQVAALSLLDARTISIQPWDVSVVKAIEKGINTSPLGLAPIADGKTIRITVPTLNEERRRELVKVIHRQGEESKVAIRNIRRDANEEIKKLKKDGTFTEDDEHKAHDAIQKLTDDTSKKIDETMTHKEKDILEV